MICANILGLGPSLQRFLKERPAGISVGVNDIWKYYPAEFVVCIDSAQVFSRERAEIIRSCRPVKFYSHLNEWTSVHPEAFTKLNLSGRFDSKLFNKWESLPRGLDSTFVAACVAWHIGARRIVIYGADFYGHPKLGIESKLKRILKSYSDLRISMGLTGTELLVGSIDSALAEVIPVL